MGADQKLLMRIARQQAKSLVYGFSGPGAPISGHLSAKGWNVRFARGIEELRSACGQGSFPVGIVELGGNGFPVPAVADLVHTCGQRMRWIALVFRDALLDGEIRNLIGSAFYDFHTLPADLERLTVTVGRALGMAFLADPAERVAHREVPPRGMVGSSAPIQALRKVIAKAAAADAPVMIQGESGTGKELAALSIHAASPRSSGPFVPVNCAAIPNALIHSELFGYEKGAFTGAARRTVGKVEAAQGGSLFLDEIGDLAPDLQVTLLRFLQQGRIQRVGGTAEIPVDVRVICATHVNLRQAVREGRFREDLFYRINVLELHMPPLRERVDDIEPLARYFFARFASERQPHIKGFSRSAIEAMCRYDWPGNVRELINRVRNALVMSENAFISPDDLGLGKMHGAPRLVSLEEARANAEREAIELALPRARHNLSGAARLLGVSRGTLYRLMEKHGLRKAISELAE